MNLLNKIFMLNLILISSIANLFAQDCKSKLIVNTDLDSSRIFINDKFTGFGRIELFLDKGSYVVKAMEPNYIWDPRKFIDTVLINKCGSTMEINLSFDSTFYLRTSPEDASVYARDSLIGYTPLFLSNNFQEIELRKNDYEKKIINPNSILPGQAIDLNFAGSRKGKSFFEKDAFKILIGSIVVLGSTTAYFKLIANDKFDDYQATGSQSSLNDTRKYDLISGITMGLLQINFGVLIYYFLTD